MSEIELASDCWCWYPYIFSLSPSFNPRPHPEQSWRTSSDSGRWRGLCQYHSKVVIRQGSVFHWSDQYKDCSVFTSCNCAGLSGWGDPSWLERWSMAEQPELNKWKRYNVARGRAKDLATGEVCVLCVCHWKTLEQPLQIWVSTELSSEF